MPILSLGCYLCFCPTGYKSGVPTTPSLGSLNLLEQLTELRNPIYSLDYRFIIKAYNSGTASQMKEMHGTMYVGTCAELLRPPECPTLPS